jgi:hypothetical protein
MKRGWLLAALLLLPSCRQPAPAATSGPEWQVANGQFTDAARLVGAAGQVLDARAAVPGAEAAAAARNPDGSLAIAAVGPGDMGAALVRSYKVVKRLPDGAGTEHVETADGMKGRLWHQPGRAMLALGMDQATADARAAAVAPLN